MYLTEKTARYELAVSGAADSDLVWRVSSGQPTVEAPALHGFLSPDLHRISGLQVISQVTVHSSQKHYCQDPPLGGSLHLEHPGLLVEKTPCVSVVEEPYYGLL